MKIKELIESLDPRELLSNSLKDMLILLYEYNEKYLDKYCNIEFSYNIYCTEIDVYGFREETIEEIHKREEKELKEQEKIKKKFKDVEKLYFKLKDELKNDEV